ncbi:hypothetical protein CLV49_1226 [Labedella gwakjiensis]|uniref:Glycosyl hydrolase family 32 n=2 Tax=Labedella gwakjiensis TaxID=390269 RepID=A0A2P8GUH8_9MICO|nr:hypothetical protein [Labedella gwakjiensis]PSL37619.1 hypothetical protein CLV49_1226 [Labedella gwakjiensis]
MSRHPRSRFMRLAALAAAGALALGATVTEYSPPSAVALAPLPVFTEVGEITVDSQLTYNPTGEQIFPSVLHASEYFANPLGEWYLYYAPHENPGGISLMYADDLDGPWTEHTANPVVANVWQPHYSTYHVSSPDVIWNTQADKLFLYFHGGNDVTRIASSDDGITFDYEKIAVDNAASGTGVTETSYARVFPHPDPASIYEYAMFYMDKLGNKRRIRVAESVDGLDWVVRPTPLVGGGSDGDNVSGGNLWEWEGQLYVIYHAGSGRIHSRTVDPTLTTTGPLVALYGLPDPADPTKLIRAAAPEIVSAEGKTYLFYEQGDRLNATISLAVSDAYPSDQPFDVDATATSTCANGVARVTVRAHNESGRAVDIGIATSYGGRQFNGVADGATVAPTLSSGGASIPSGTATITLVVRPNGVATSATITAPYTAITC